MSEDKPKKGPALPVVEFVDKLKTVSLPSVDYAGAVAVGISDMVNPSLSVQEQAVFIAGFQECIKWLNIQPAAASPVSDVGEAVALLKSFVMLIESGKPTTHTIEHAKQFIATYENPTPTNVQEQGGDYNQAIQDTLSIIQKYNTGKELSPLFDQLVPKIEALKKTIQ